MNLLEILKTKGIKVSDLAKWMDINPGQIYRWNKNGIKESNPHYPALKKMFPELEAIETKTTINGTEDQRSYNTSDKHELHLQDVEHKPYEEKVFLSTETPRLPGIKDEYGLPYVKVEDRGPEWYAKRKNLKKVNPLINQNINWDRLPNK